MDSDSDYIPTIDIVNEGRKLQIQSDQLTMQNLAKIFNVVPDTLFLVSEDGHVVLPDQFGMFVGIQSYRTWKVEGVKSSKGVVPAFGKSTSAASSPSGSFSASGGSSSGIRVGKWKPKLPTQQQQKQHEEQVSIIWNVCL